MQKIVAALSGALVLALVVIAYLLGQRSAPPAAPGGASPVPAPLVATRELPPPPEPRAGPPPASASASTPAPAPAPAPVDPREVRVITNEAGEVLIANGRSASSPPAEAAPAPRAPPAPGTEATEASVPAGAAPSVEAYFERMDALQAGPAEDDAKSFSQELITSMLRNDYSGFDRLAEDLDRAEQQARGIKPPAACAEYHNRLIGYLGESRQLMTGMRDAIRTKNLDALNDLSARASKLQDQVRSLKDLEKSLRGS
ncbi:MAG: hypothetical protein IT384_27610 [Deltaproteobacteria bacterium]|nr:hypothetical protein [Deltaproteobacteria bacterium]